MFKSLLLAGAATALVAAPAAARDYRYDGYRYYRGGNGDAVAGALIGAVAGAALASSLNNHRDYGYSSYGYSYPAYGYGYGYPAYGYAYPSYGYAYPSYGYSYPSYGYGYPSYGYAYPGYTGPSYGLSVNIGSGGYYGRHYRPRYRRGW